MKFEAVEFLLAGNVCFLLDLTDESEVYSALSPEFLSMLETKSVSHIKFGRQAENGLLLSELLKEHIVTLEGEGNHDE